MLTNVMKSFGFTYGEIARAARKEAGSATEFVASTRLLGQELIIGMDQGSREGDKTSVVIFEKNPDETMTLVHHEVL